MTSNREKLNQLIAQKELLELEAEAISSELTSKGPNNEPPAGLKDPLIDKDGFPRGDIDLYNVRNKRNRLAVINTDHKELMKQIEKIMHLVYLESTSQASSNSDSITTSTTSSSSSTSTSTSSNTNPQNNMDIKSLLPIAKIDEILPGSPAASSGLMDGDKLISFAHINNRTANALVAIPAVLRENIGKPIEVVILRNIDTYLTLTLTPQIWGGRGVLGCHLTPILT